MTAAVALARRHVELPNQMPGTPGPVAYDDPDYLNAILTAASFQAVDFVPVAGLLPVGGPGSTPESALTFARNALSTGRILLDYPENIQQAVAADLLELYAVHHRRGEGVMMGYAAWLVSATA